MARTRKKRRTAADAPAPSATFLAALEAQRASARSQQEREQQPSAPDTTSDAASMDTDVEASSEPRELPGFYYDAVKRRYFKLSEQQQKQQRRALKIRLATRVKKTVNEGSSGDRRQHHGSRRGGLLGAGLPASTLQQCLDLRQQGYGWNARGCDRRDLGALFLSRHFVSFDCFWLVIRD